MTRVLIAEDELNLRKILRTLLEREGYTVIAVENGQEALNTLQQEGIDIVLTDLKMPGMSGLDLLSAIKHIDPGLPVILMTAHGSVDTAVTALKNGAFDYITKPFDKDELKLAIRKAASVRTLNQHKLHDNTDASGRFRIIGQSPRMRDIYTMIERVAPTPSTVLITGESGTGKELVASALHQNSTRNTKPFIKVNCAAIPKDLMESEFFGYEQGAFTGAVASKPGRFELADGGTLFLDEIGEIPPAMQVKLLRALQEGEFERVGGVRTIQVDVRVVTATNRDLISDIAAGIFREDLYYRLNVVPMHLPPLRERKEDMPLLIQAFIEKYNKRLSRHVSGISVEALHVLTLHDWPGNIRELENVIERMILFTDHTELQSADVPDDIRRASLLAIQQKTLEPFIQQINTHDTSLKSIVKHATYELERDFIVRALEETQGNVTRAANLLKISRKGLQNKMKELGLRDTSNTQDEELKK